MAEHSPTNVWAAYEILLEELETEISRLNDTGGRAFRAGEHARAQELLARVRQLTGVRNELVALGRTLRPLVDQAGAGGERPRLPHGLKTPEEACRLPILRALVEMGGSGEAGPVLHRVFEQMKGRLNEHDLAPMPSDERTPRWRNTAQWCRYTMCQEGLLKADSPRGLWEISDRGRQWLAAQR